MDVAEPVGGDTIEIRGLRLLCHVGLTDAERAVAQPVEVDLDLSVDLSVAASSDSVSDTVDYGAVAVAVAEAVVGEHALLERLAAVAADAALAVDDRTSAVVVAIRKLRPPVPLDVASTGVRLHRRR